MTKRILSILVAALMVMALIPMSVFASAEASRSGNASQFGKIQAQANKDAAIAFDFEYSAESEFDTTLVYADGDGYNWEWVGYGINQTQYLNSAYEGIGYIESASYNEVALTPDNYAISPAIDLPEDATTLSFWSEAQDPS